MNLTFQKFSPFIWIRFYKKDRLYFFLLRVPSVLLPFLLSCLPIAFLPSVLGTTRAEQVTTQPGCVAFLKYILCEAQAVFITIKKLTTAIA